MPQDRTNAVQGEVVWLYRTFIFNGVLYDLPDAPSVTLLDESGTELATVTATRERQGLYYAAWTVPVDLAPGKYYDRWSFKFLGNDETRVETSYWQLFRADTFISFQGGTASSQVTDRIAVLMNALVTIKRLKKL